MKNKKPRGGRERVGEPISITVTDAQRDWLDSRIPPGGNRASLVRAIIQAEIDRDARRVKR